MKSLFVLAIALVTALSGCQSVPQSALQAASGAVGATIGHEVSGEPEGAIVGAAAGAVAGKAFNYWREAGELKAYTNGYQKGQSDEVMRLYWISKRLQEDQSEGTFSRGYYEIPVPEHVTKDGVVIEPHTQIVEVIEP